MNERSKKLENPFYGFIDWNLDSKIDNPFIYIIMDLANQNK